MSVTKSQRRESHKQRMIARRAGQRARVPGFTPVANSRVDDALQAETLKLTLAGMHPVEAQGEARRRIAAMLPVRKASKLYRHKPSKSDSAAYRKSAA